MFENYKSLKTTALLAIIGLGAMLFFSILNFIFGVGNLLAPDKQVTLDEQGSVSVWLMMIGIMQILRLPVYVFTVVFFLIWLNRAYKNLQPLKAQSAEFTPGWAVGWWFVPFLNLFKPFQVVRELWNQSDPDFDENLNFLPNSLETPSFLGFWWGFWLISNITLQVFDRTLDSQTSVAPVSTAFLILSAIFGAAAALLAIKVVGGITKRQEERFVRIEQIIQNNLPPSPQSYGI